MIPGKNYTPDDVLRSLWRRKWQILVCFVLGTTAAIVVSSQLRDRFRAEALILTVPQSVSQEYVRATVTTKTQLKDRLPTITEQIQSRARLEPIITTLDLYADMRRTKPMEAVIDRMRRDIQIQIVGGSESLRVGFEAETPALAVHVTEKLAELFIEENLRDRAVMARATSSFLESQLKDARDRLVVQEKRLEAYRLQYGAELPTQLQSNMQAIQNIQLQIQSLNESLNRDRDRRLMVARQIADLQSEQFLIDPGTGAALQSGGAGSHAQDISASSQLETALAELKSLELRLTPEHPDLLRAKRLVEDLEKQAQKEAAPKSEEDAPTPVRPLTVTEIARRNRLKELQAEIESLDRQIAKRLADEVELRQTFQTYRDRVEAVPTRESELASLTRDYDTLQGLYRTLLAKNEDSKVAEELERRQVGEQFKVVDPPRRPERPIRPNRPLIDLGGALGGLVFGVALAALLEFLDGSVKVAADIQAVVPCSVLATIPSIRSAAERRRARWRKAGFSLGLAAIFAACAATMWLTFRI